MIEVKTSLLMCKIFPVKEYPATKAEGVVLIPSLVAGNRHDYKKGTDLISVSVLGQWRSHGLFKFVLVVFLLLLLLPLEL